MSGQLFIGLNWLGDVIMSFPAITLAARGRPDAEIEVVTRSHLAPLYGLHPAVKNIWTLPADRSPFAALGLLRRLRRRQFETITVLPQSFRTAVLAFLAGGRRRVGFATQGRSLLLTDSRPLPEGWKSLHESTLHASLVEQHCTFDPARVDPLPTPRGATKAVETCLTRFGISTATPFLVFAPGAAFGPAKRWFPERFAELGARLAVDSDLSILVTGTAGEKEITSRVATEIGPRARDIGGTTTLPELIALLSRAKLLVANDSGTMHLAAILGTPVVVAVGSTDMTRTGPLGARHRLVIGESCAPPCRRSTCSLGTYACLASITVGRMETACRELLNERPSGNV